MKRPRSPVLRPFFWTDGTTALPLTREDVPAWLERGVSYGWVVAADDATHAKKIGQGLDERTKRS